MKWPPDWEPLLDYSGTNPGPPSNYSKTTLGPPKNHPGTTLGAPQDQPETTLGPPIDQAITLLCFKFLFRKHWINNNTTEITTEKLIMTEMITKIIIDYVIWINSRSTTKQKHETHWLEVTPSILYLVVFFDIFYFEIQLCESDNLKQQSTLRYFLSKINDQLLRRTL